MNFTPTITSTFGFHTKHTVPITPSIQNKVYYNPRLAAKDAHHSNLFNFLGYIPIVGFLSCARNFISPMLLKNHSLHKQPTSIKVAYYVRGIFEGLGLGILYLLPDLAITAYRLVTSYDARSSKNLIKCGYSLGGMSGEVWHLP